MSIILAASLAAASSASAAFTISSGYDFRSSAYAGVNGASSPKVVGELTFTGSNSVPLINEGQGTFTHNSSDGIGWNTPQVPDQSDEINIYEAFRVGFGGTSGNGLTGVWITDLFDQPGQFNDAEKGYYRIDGGSWVSFIGANSVGGEQFLDFGGPIDVTSVDFSVGKIFGSPSYAAVSNFSVGGFTKLSADPSSGQVPDSGSTMILLGGTMLGLGGMRRFLTAKK